MADNKRNSVAGKVATPNLKAGTSSGKDVIGADSDLYKAVGSRIKVTCAPGKNVLEGTLFTACNLTHAIAINTAPAPPNPSASIFSQPGDYHIIPFAHIESFEIIGTGERASESAPGFDGALPSISKVDLAALQAREDQTIREMKKKDMQKGKGVSPEAQELFDAISRTLPTRWADTQIVVSDSVLIQAPYTLDNIKAPSDKQQAENHVRKVVERFYQRKKGAASGGAARAPVAVPNAPRKGAAKELNEIRNAWKRAPVTVSSLCSQLKLTGASLSQIQSLLLSDTDVLQEKPALIETLDTTLTSCLVLSTWLEKYMLKITKGVLDTSRLDWKAKFKTLWNDDEVKELQEQLHQQHAAISTLVGLLQMDSLTEMKKLIQKHGKMLQRIANDTQRMREAHSIEAAESILGTDDSSSIFSKLPIRDDISDHHSGSLFESEVLKSNVYSKALNNTMKQTADIEPDDANTVADDGMTMYNDDSDCTIDSPITEEDSASALMAGTPTFAPFSASFTSAINYLRVGTIGALSLENYTAQSPKELSLKCYNDIVALRKLDEWRYLEDSAWSTA
ncbi:unnamed protein product [Alternaria alternata]